MNPYTLLARVPDRSRPAVTHYAGPDARVELSIATLVNGVAKAAGLLRDGLGLAPGARVSVDLPLHWQLPVWTVGALAVGGHVGRGEADEVDVRIVGPAGAALGSVGAGPRSWRADALLVSSCDAFGMPMPAALPAGVLDVGIEARAHPDVFSPDREAEQEAALMVAGDSVAWAVLAAAAPDAGRRVWIGDGDIADDRLLHAALRPLLAQGSIVLASGVPPQVAQRLRRVEGISA